MHLNESNGYWYVRRSNGAGKETVAKLGQLESNPAIYKPELLNDKAENLLARLPDESIDAVITDPPYGVDVAAGREEEEVWNDRDLGFLEHVAKELHRVLKPDSHAYVFTNWQAYPEMMGYFEEHFDFSSLLVWDKQLRGLGPDSVYAPRHEFVMHLKKGTPDFHSKWPDNVIEYSRAKIRKVEKVHPTQKPIGVIDPLIEHSTDPLDVVIDPFGGSYAVARASMRKFRKSISCELDPELHGKAVQVVQNQLTDDPVYGIDWTEVSNLNVEQVEMVKTLQKA